MLDMSSCLCTQESEDCAARVWFTHETGLDRAFALTRDLVVLLCSPSVLRVNTNKQVTYTTKRVACTPRAHRPTHV